MDALKKAEAAKRRAESGTPADEGQVAAPGIDMSMPLGEELQLVEDESRLDAELSGGASPLVLEELDNAVSPDPRSAAATVEAEQRESIQNLFDTKQSAPSRRGFAIVVGVATLIAAAGIGGWFWYQLQPQNTLLVRAPVAAAPTAATGLNQSTAGPLPLPPAPGMPATATPPQPQAVDLHMRQGSSPRAGEAEDDETGVRSAPPPAPPKVFQITTPTAQTNPALDRAYGALMQNDDAGARAAYAKALAADPNNTDALAGLAVLAQRAGDNALAADYYQRMLGADPKNAAALAGLINLQSRLDTQDAETRVKQALSSQPDSAPLNFALGNIYARDKRWREAQQAYFRAVANDAGNPDYLFNLAVSLDQIRQPRLASTYYAQAISSANTRPASFDTARASERLQQLQQSQAETPQRQP